MAVRLVAPTPASSLALAAVASGSERSVSGRPDASLVAGARRALSGLGSGGGCVGRPDASLVAGASLGGRAVRPHHRAAIRRTRVAEHREVERQHDWGFMAVTSNIKVAVIGAGSWGTTVAALAAANTPTVLWARRRELADHINDAKINPEYLPAFPLPDELRATDSLAEAVGGADVVVMAVPSHGFRDVAVEAAASIRPWVPIVSLAKGIERTTLQRMSEVAAEVMPGHPVAVLTGPNLAKEILAGQPAASVVAIDEATIAGELQQHLQPAEPARVHEHRRDRL